MITLGHSRTRDAIVRELFAEPETEWHVRGLARQTGEAVANVHRELARLERGGWIVRRREGNRVLVRVNEAHPLYGEMRDVVAKTIGVPPVLAAALSEVGGIQYAALIEGSSSAGGAGAPLQLLVVGEPGNVHPQAVADALRPATQWLQREVELTIVGVDELRHLVAQRSHCMMRLLGLPRRALVGDEPRLRAMVSDLVAADDLG